MLIAVLRALSSCGVCAVDEIGAIVAADGDAVRRALAAAEGVGAAVRGADGRWRAAYPVEWLSAEAIAANVGDASLRVEVATEIDSTFAAAGTAPPPAGGAHLIAAEYQRAGRGRRGRTWRAAPGGSLLFSLVAQVARAPARCGGLTLAAGVAVLRALDRTAPGLRLKWPNDLVNRRGEKVGGILTELAPEADGARQARVSVGVGVNLEMPPALAALIGRPVAGLRARAGGGAFARSRMIADIASELRRALADFGARGFSFFHAEACARHAVGRGERIVFHDAGGRRRAIFYGIGGGGELLIDGGDGGIETAVVGEVENAAGD